MSVVINGILNLKLPWGLVLLGVFLVITDRAARQSARSASRSALPRRHHRREICGWPGEVPWPKRGQKQTEEGEASPGALHASGLYRRRRIVGLLAIEEAKEAADGFRPA